MPDYTTTALLASIRRRGSIPSSTSSGSADADLLAIASEQLLGRVSALVRNVREDYFATQYTVSTVAGTAAYNIPQRAQGGGLQEVELVDSAGEVSDLEKISRRDLSLRETSRGRPSEFYFEDDQIVLSPPPDAVYTLRIPYFRRCGVLVTTAGIQEVTVVTPSVPTEIEVTENDDMLGVTTLDFVRATPGFRSLGIDYEATGNSGGVISFATSYPTGLEVGDYVCLPGESPVPQVPVEFHPILAQAAANEWMRGPGRDREGAAEGERILKQMEEEVLAMLSPRVEGERQVMFQGGYFGGG